jgi:hypothetical protein
MCFTVAKHPFSREVLQDLVPKKIGGNFTSPLSLTLCKLEEVQRYVSELYI